tara:strand:+ start:2621 stop:3565 length:945 start_codon:yes stop_codon:yes gene_type:complete
MATYTTSASVGERESLEDVIYRIDPTETPLFTAAAKKTINNVQHDWLVQELAAAADDNHVNEGADYSYVNPSAPTRFSNICQISAKAASVSGTLDAVDTAGRARETAYVKILKGLEIRRDVEKSLFKNEAKSSSDPRKTAKLMTWLTNGDKPSDMGHGTGDGSDTCDLTGTARALTLAQIEAAIKEAYEDGGAPSMLVMSPANKVAFSGLSSGSVSTNQITSTAPQEAAIIGSVSLFLSDFGTVEAVVDRQAPNSEMYVIDKDYVAIGSLPGRNFSVSDVAPTGDATKFAILYEWSLIVEAPKAHAFIFGLNTS